VPPLRERRGDIPRLVEHFIHRYARQTGKPIRGIDRFSLDLLKFHDWPGNVRELQNIIERAVVISDSETLAVDEHWLSRKPPIAAFAMPAPRRTLATIERHAIENALLETKGRIAGPFGAASSLGIPSSTLESRIKALGIDKRRFKPAPPALIYKLPAERARAASGSVYSPSTPVRRPRDTQEITLVGAGLAGSLLAIFLARRGYRVTLLERRRDPRKASTAAPRCPREMTPFQRVAAD